MPNKTATRILDGIDSLLCLAALVLLLVKYFDEADKPNNPYNNGQLAVAGIFVWLAIPLLAVKAFYHVFNLCKDREIEKSEDIKTSMEDYLLHSTTGILLTGACLLLGLIFGPQSVDHHDQVAAMAWVYFGLLLAVRVCDVAISYSRYDLEVCSPKLPQKGDTQLRLYLILGLLIGALLGLLFSRIDNEGHNGMNIGETDGETLNILALIAISLHILLVVIEVFVMIGKTCTKDGKEYSTENISNVVALNTIPWVRSVVVTFSIVAVSCDFGYMWQSADVLATEANSEPTLMVLSVVCILLVDIIGLNVG